MCVLDEIYQKYDHWVHISDMFPLSVFYKILVPVGYPSKYGYGLSLEYVLFDLYLYDCASLPDIFHLKISACTFKIKDPDIFH